MALQERASVMTTASKYSQLSYCADEFKDWPIPPVPAQYLITKALPPTPLPSPNPALQMGITKPLSVRPRRPRPRSNSFGSVPLTARVKENLQRAGSANTKIAQLPPPSAFHRSIARTVARPATPTPPTVALNVQKRYHTIRAPKSTYPTPADVDVDMRPHPNQFYLTRHGHAAEAENIPEKQAATERTLRREIRPRVTPHSPSHRVVAPASSAFKKKGRPGIPAQLTKVASPSSESGGVRLRAKLGRENIGDGGMARRDAIDLGLTVEVRKAGRWRERDIDTPPPDVPQDLDEDFDPDAEMNDANYIHSYITDLKKRDEQRELLPECDMGLGEREATKKFAEKMEMEMDPDDRIRALANWTWPQEGLGTGGGDSETVSVAPKTKLPLRRTVSVPEITHTKSSTSLSRIFHSSTHTNGTDTPRRLSRTDLTRSGSVRERKPPFRHAKNLVNSLRGKLFARVRTSSLTSRGSEKELAVHVHVHDHFKVTPVVRREIPRSKTPVAGGVQRVGGWGQAEMWG